MIISQLGPPAGLPTVHCIHTFLVHPHILVVKLWYVCSYCSTLNKAHAHKMHLTVRHILLLGTCFVPTETQAYVLNNGWVKYFAVDIINVKVCNISDVPFSSLCCKSQYTYSFDEFFVYCSYWLYINMSVENVYVRTLKKGYVHMWWSHSQPHGRWSGNEARYSCFSPRSLPSFLSLYGFVHDGQLGSGRETRLEVSKRGEQKRDGEKDWYFIVLPVAHFSRTGQSP